MSLDQLSNVAYKKGNWMRYTLWGLAAVCIAILISTFINVMNSEISAAVPEGYRFSVTDNYNEGSKVRTTYYVYKDHIIVEDESFDDNAVNRALMIYDGISTTSLSYNADDVTEVCELGACYERPKVLAVIKNLISRKVGREYIGV
ncbi:hypothetical protein IJJ36_02495 [Candidatus Saccharibacteria bacterium]|nr:hypothetical protein [Candidatus Saccharibacteria bacterium]MBR3263750.1 hypothetical protein [Candidatus Saccharibacteria bacterium]